MLLCYIITHGTLHLKWKMLIWWGKQVFMRPDVTQTAFTKAYWQTTFLDLAREGTGVQT